MSRRSEIGGEGFSVISISRRPGGIRQAASAFSNFCGSAASFNWTGEMLREMRGAPGQFSASVDRRGADAPWVSSPMRPVSSAIGMN